MQFEIQLASFNVRNLALPDIQFYENTPSYTKETYLEKINWLARVFDETKADLLGLQEIFSPVSLFEIIPKTTHFKNAHVITYPQKDVPITPHVALISNLEVTEFAFYEALPDFLQMTLPGGDSLLFFSRPVLVAKVKLPNRTKAYVFVAHFKSKRADIIDKPPESLKPEMGALRSLMRRAVDALGVKHLLFELRKKDPIPAIVMGDFNDFSQATTTEILSGENIHQTEFVTNLLMNAFDHDPYRTKVDRFSTLIPRTSHPRIDHIFLTDEFSETSHFKAGCISSTQYLIDHLKKDEPYLSDHAPLIVRLRLNPY